MKKGSLGSEGLMGGSKLPNKGFVGSDIFKAGGLPKPKAQSYLSKIFHDVFSSSYL